MYIYNYDPKELNYIVQVQHPCSGEIVSSGIYQLPAVTTDFTITASSSGAAGLIYEDYCTMPTKATLRLNINTTGIQSYVCEPNYKITAVPSSGVGTATYEYQWTSGTSTAFTLTNLDAATTYSVTISDATTGEILKNISASTLNPNNVYMGITVSANTSYGYNYGNCDFETGVLYTSSITSSTYYTRSTNHPITYSIKSAPQGVVRDPVTRTTQYTSTSSSYILWNDLPFGQYVIEVDYGCRKVDQTINLNPTVTGFEWGEVSYEASAVCGKYDIKTLGYFLNSLGNPYTSTSSYFRYNVRATNLATNTSTLNSGYGYSNYEVTIESLDPGEYRLQFYPYYRNGSASTAVGTCIYGETYITLPDYDPPVINVPLSGGISCTDGVANMHVAAIGARRPFQYRYRKYEDEDIEANYCSWQVDSVFTNVYPGRYMVKVVDDCGSVTTQELNVYNGSDQFVGLIGAVREGAICEGKPAQISVLSIGPVQTYQWYKDGVLLAGETGPTYDIESADQSHIGEYMVEIFTGSCYLTSGIEILYVLPPPETPVITADGCVLTENPVLLTAHTSIENPTFQWYRNENVITGAIGMIYAATQPGFYYVIVTPFEECPSDPSNVLVVTPSELYWRQDAEDHNWFNAANWADRDGQPIHVMPCSATNIFIPGYSDHYPSLDMDNTPQDEYGVPSCSSITFEFGGEIAYPHILNYQKAFIQYDWGYYGDFTQLNEGDQPDKNASNNNNSFYVRGNWNILAAPLKKMASGDFTFAGYPLAWQALYNTTHPESGILIEGDFSKSFSSIDTDLSTTNNALAIKIAAYKDEIGYKDHMNLEGLKGILEIPYFENQESTVYHSGHYYNKIFKRSTFYYFDTKTLLPLSSPVGTINRGEEGYRFIFEEDDTNEAYTIQVKGQTVPGYKQEVTYGASPENSVMIGNPFVSSINSKQLYDANDAVLDKDYGYYIFSAETSTWTHFNFEADQNIAPLQAFVVKIKSNPADIVFPLEGTYALTGSGYKGDWLRSATVSGFLSVKLNSSADPALLKTDEESNSKTVKKMIHPDGHEVAEVFFINPDDLSYNLVQNFNSNWKEVGLGIKTSQQDATLKLEFENIREFAQEKEVRPVLVDKILNVEKDLTFTNVYTFTQRSVSADNQYSDTERFSIRFEPFNSENADDLLMQLDIYYANKEGLLEVKSNESLNLVQIYNVQGSLLFSEDIIEINVTNYKKYISLPDGVYIVKVQSKEGKTAIKKIIK